MIWSQSKLIKVLNFASDAHGEQKEPSGRPYLRHVVAVMMEVMGASPYHSEKNLDLALPCALLHDTIEDTAVTYEDIRIEFGVSVADGVLALTKNETLPRAEQMLDSLDRILKQPDEIAMVKLGDRITNLSPPPAHWDNEKISNYKDEAIVISKRLGHASDYLKFRLDQKIVNYDKFII